MLKKILISSIAVILVGGIGVLGFLKFKSMSMGINPNKLDKVVTDKELLSHDSELERIYGFSGKDLSKKDMSKVSLEVLSKISFDSSTKWPKENNLPKGFNPNSYMSICKDPGLNLSKIHDSGITGKGVSVAVIDKPIRTNHSEFDDRMNYIKVGSQTSEHFHGMACASILAGKTCGVAPEAKLYYFSSTDTNNKFSTVYIDSINKLLEINKALSEKEKIKVVSISDGFKEEPGEQLDKWQETVKKANSEGVTIVYSNILSKKKFAWGGCIPSKDRNNPANYELDKLVQKNDSRIIVPGDFRTTASNNKDNEYVYWGESGFSWAIPYVAGMAALAWQVNPTLSFDEIIDKLVATKTVTSEGLNIIDPEAFIKAINK